jgi:hypothetical protein
MNAIIAFLIWLWSVLTYIPRRLFGRGELLQKQKLHRSARVEDIPDDPTGFTVYLVGEGGNLWAAAMLCPCGCGERIELNLLPQVRPRWSAEEHEDCTVTLTPSVWRQSGCRSHFILRHGCVIWC